MKQKKVSSLASLKNSPIQCGSCRLGLETTGPGLNYIYIASQYHTT